MNTDQIQSNLKNARQRVLFRFWIAKVRNDKFRLYTRPDIYISGGWLPVFAVQEALIGGSSADRRLRELKEINNIPFECKVHKWNIGDRKMKTYIHRLKCNTGDINWKELFDKWPDYRFPYPWKYEDQKEAKHSTTFTPATTL